MEESSSYRNCIDYSPQPLHRKKLFAMGLGAAIDKQSSQLIQLQTSSALFEIQENQFQKSKQNKGGNKIKETEYFNQLFKTHIKDSKLLA